MKSSFCYCGNLIKRSRDKTCSRKCYLFNRFGGTRKQIKTCRCGENFEAWPSRNRQFCSQSCGAKYRVVKNRKKYEIKVQNRGWFKTTNTYHCYKEFYQAVHIWIRRHKSYPERCEHCKEVKKLDWANISKDYKRVLDDWIALCRKCHWQYDHKGY